MVTKFENRRVVKRSALYTPAPTEFTERSALTEIYGDTGTGRTSLALSAPGPIALLHAGEKVSGIVERFAQVKEIQQHSFFAHLHGSPDKIAKDAAPVWERLSSAFYDALTWARTIVIDTHTDAWELLRLREFGDYKPAKGRVDSNYGPINAEWGALIKAQRAHPNVNVILIGQTKDEWTVGERGQGTRTGRTIRAGQRSVSIAASAVVRTYNPAPGEYSAVIEKCWRNPQALGIEIPNPTWSEVMGVVTMTDPEEWES